jgi:RNA 3'-terminal phosphate cyclase (ATP)
MLEIDGSYGEGGGQLLRMAVALAAIQGRAIRVTNVRAGRQKPGLQAQHLTAVAAVAALSSARVDGLDMGSTEIAFRPGPLTAGRFAFDVGTAGSVSLVVQACLPVALAAPGPVQLGLRGGTDVRRAPPADYLAFVLLPLLRRLGARVSFTLLRRGYYPRGGGLVEVDVEPATVWGGLRLLHPDPVKDIRGRVHTSRLPGHVAERMNETLRNSLSPLAPVEFQIAQYSADESAGPGGGVVAWTEQQEAVLAADSPAERGKPAEEVAREAAGLLADEVRSGATLDRFTADQVVAYLARSPESSSYLVREASGHLRTMAWLIELLLDRPVRIEPAEGLWRVSL